MHVAKWSQIVLFDCGFVEHVQRALLGTQCEDFLKTGPGLPCQNCTNNSWEICIQIMQPHLCLWAEWHCVLESWQRLGFYLMILTGQAVTGPHCGRASCSITAGCGCVSHICTVWVRMRPPHSFSIFFFLLQTFSSVLRSVCRTYTFKSCTLKDYLHTHTVRMHLVI